MSKRHPDQGPDFEFPPVIQTGTGTGNLSSEDRKQAFLCALIELGKQHEVVAKIDALEAVKRSHEPEAMAYMEHAKRSLARHSACEELIRRTIDLAHKHWPK